MAIEERENALSIVEAREQLSRLPEKFAREAESHQGPGAVAITWHNKPVLAILSWELYESIMETLEILSDEALMTELRQSVQDAKDSKGERWEDVKRELGW